MAPDNGGRLNVRRGLFRLWAITSVLFMLCVTVISYSSLREQFRNESIDWDAEVARYGGYTEEPTFCNVARGVSGKDYEERDGLCWYRSEDLRRLYPEYRDISNKDLSEKLYAKVGQPLHHEHPWRSVERTAALAIGLPLGLLALGWAVLWAVAGFRG